MPATPFWQDSFPRTLVSGDHKIDGRQYHERLGVLGVLCGSIFRRSSVCLIAVRSGADPGNVLATGKMEPQSSPNTPTDVCQDRLDARSKQKTGFGKSTKLPFKA
jgi:hypothetical protein